jgi:hypothetical protein
LGYNTADRHLFVVLKSDRYTKLGVACRYELWISDAVSRPTTATTKKLIDMVTKDEAWFAIIAMYR